jgi:hypothetical protein
MQQDEPNKKSDTGAEEDDDNVVFGEILPQNLHRTFEDGRPGDRKLVSPPDDPGEVAEDENQGIGKQELIKFFADVKMAEKKSFDGHSNGGHDQGPQDHRPPELTRGIDEKGHELVGEVGPQHVKGAVCEIQNSQDPENQ